MVLLEYHVSYRVELQGSSLFEISTATGEDPKCRSNAALSVTQQRHPRV